jgi:hypothetical protein
LEESTSLIVLPLRLGAFAGTFSQQTPQAQTASDSSRKRSELSNLSSPEYNLIHHDEIYPYSTTFYRWSGVFACPVYDSGAINAAETCDPADFENYGQCRETEIGSVAAA